MRKEKEEMIRKIIQIDEAKCNGCGLCAEACHENAIGMVDGKARLLRDDYCDGLGDCLPACPMDAISFVEREAAPYDKEAVMKNIREKSGTMLAQWPVQIKLAPVRAPYFQEADLLIAADCTAYAYGKFHEAFMKDKITLIGCTKLDGIDYSEKLGEIFKQNDIRSVMVIRMEVPCCRGMELAVRKALEASGKSLPLQVSVISVDGRIL